LPHLTQLKSLPVISDIEKELEKMVEENEFVEKLSKVIDSLKEGDKVDCEDFKRL